MSITVLPASKIVQLPTELTLAVLGGKWKTVILCYLKQQPWWYSDLRRLVRELSDKVLTQRQRDLVAMGLVVHHKQGLGRCPLGHYALTSKGRSLGNLLHQIYDWGDQHAKMFDVEVGYPLKTCSGVSRPDRSALSWQLIASKSVTCLPRIKAHIEQCVLSAARQ